MCIITVLFQKKWLLHFIIHLYHRATPLKRGQLYKHRRSDAQFDAVSTGDTDVIGKQASNNDFILKKGNFLQNNSGYPPYTLS